MKGKMKLKQNSFLLLVTILLFFIMYGIGCVLFNAQGFSKTQNFLNLFISNANFGDGFCNYILPHSTALMGIISAVNIPYDRWMKFMWKLFLIWAVTACIMTAIAQGIHLGPM